MTEITIKQAFFRKHLQIDSILWKNILQQQISLCAKVFTLKKTDNISQRNRCGRVQNKIKSHILQILLDSPLKLGLQ